ncbi:nucleotide-binding domain containing protein [Streptomyces sp. P1-3]|uniref:nucleotide-binding domain containing protein n=1 Tax=Streptomyces sp. P1-3 TaxID=3421658 RepID=UPI003D35F8D2
MGRQANCVRHRLHEHFAAARTGARRRAVVIAPAFPGEGRTTEGTVQLAHGVPVHRTGYADDPAHPVRCSDLRTLVADATPVPPERTERLPALIAEGRTLLCSARSDGDLDRVVAAVPRLDDVLWVGSPGLAAALARRCATARPSPPAFVPEARRPLVVVGSANPVTRRQLTRLAGTDGVGVVVLSTGPTPNGAAGDAAAAAALRALPDPVRTLRTPDGRTAPDEVALLAARLAAAVRPLVEEGAVDGLLLTGGETARAVLRALGVPALELVDEPEPGVARALPPGAPGCPVLIKAGGFGDEDTLLRLCRLLTRPYPTGDRV